MNAPDPWRNDKGIALVSALGAVCFLSIFATSLVLNAANEFKVCRSFRLDKVALYVAESGTEEARGRLGTIGDSGTPTGDWRTFIGESSEATSLFGYDSEDDDHSINDSLQTGFNYTVEVRHQTEADINTDLNTDGDLDDVVYWDDIDGDYSLEKNPTDGEPVDVITSRGMFAGVTKTITTEVRRHSLFFEPPAALYVNGPLVKNGTAGSAVGDYGGCTPVPDVITTNAATVGYEASDWPAGSSTPPWFVDDVANYYPISDVVDELCENADQMVYSGNNQTFGTVSDPTGIYCSGSDFAANGLDGYGILAINGNFVTGGNISWHGILLVTGASVYNGGGSKEIYGALLANAVAVINGTVDVNYDCNAIQALQDAHSRFGTFAWRRTDS